MIQRAHSFQRLTTAMLSLAIAGLGALTWHDHATEIEITPITPERTAAIDDSAASVPDLPSPMALPDAQSAYPETTARPLFSPGRRPYVAAAVSPAAPEEAALEPPVAVDVTPPAPSPWPEGLRLVGIVSDGSTARRAIVRLAGAGPATSDVRAFEEGATLEGWRLARIDSAAAMFESAGTVKILELFTREPASVAPAASAAP